MKIFASALIAASSVLIGFCLSKRLSAASELCEELLRIMKYVRDEIAVNKTPTGVIFSRLRSRFDLSGVSDKGLYGALLPELSPLCTDEREIFRLFCEQIGKGGAEVQTTQFDALISRLGDHAEKRRAELSKNSRLYISLSLFAGVLIIIIMM